MEAASGVGACLSENDTTESEINDEYLLDLLHDMGYDVSDEDLSIFKDKLLHFIDEELDICDDTLFSSIVIDSDDDLENFASNILNGQNAECVNSVPSNITNNHHAVPCAITKAYDDLGAETIIKSAHRLLRRLDEHNMVLTNLLKMLEEESPILKESPTNSPNYSAIDYERAVNEHVEISSDTSDRTLTGNGECEVIKVDPSIRKTCIVQRGRLPFKHDPVSRHAFYKKQWSKYPPPGEKKRLSLRWAIRELLLREDTPAVAPNVLARKRGFMMVPSVAYLDRFRKVLSSHDLFGIRWLLDGFNYYDVERVKQVGHDRAAAEWIVRCEGKVKLDRWNDFIEDYNDLLRRTSCLDPKSPNDQVFVENIDATYSSVTGRGFIHLEGLRKLEEIRLIHCKRFDDDGLRIISSINGSSLRTLRIESCPKVSTYGLGFLTSCCSLQFLLLRDLQRVRDAEVTLAKLSKSLPDCEISFLP